jgi:adenylyl-sulfate kinase
MDSRFQSIGYGQSRVIWLTGLPGAGKTTVAKLIGNKISTHDFRVAHLDGDDFRKRQGINRGFNRSDRTDNVQSAARVALALLETHTLVIASFITPYEEQRRFLRSYLPGYTEVFVDAPLSVCEQRDPKGLYKKARAGLIQNFTGVDDPYETPICPDIVIKTHLTPVNECAEIVLDHIFKIPLS